MAPKKQKKKYKGPRSSSPNKVVVIFLVFFVLLSCVLGLLVYAGYDAADKAAAEAKKSQDSQRALEKDKQFYQLLALEARAAVGAELNKDADIDEQNNWALARAGFLAGSQFSEEKLAPKVKAWMQQNSVALGYNDATKNFSSTYVKKIKQLETRLQATEAEVAREKKAKEEVEKKYKDLSTQYQTWVKTFDEDSKKKNQAIIDKIMVRSGELDTIIKEKNNLITKMQDMKLAHLTELRSKEKLIRELAQELQKEQPGTKPGAPAGGGGSRGEVHALMLDVSTGKPLWDQPKGKITRVIRKDRKVYINVGSADGVKPKLTFNVFAPSKDDEAIGLVKGTIEVQQVVDEHTSLALVTSMFDKEGKEIQLYDQRRGAAGRWAENPIDDGDLIYNMFWKSRVALAGEFNLSGIETFSAARELYYLKEFKQVLENQGMIVDAYVDPTDGRVKGGITKQTRILILGDKAAESKGEELNPKMASLKVLNNRMTEMMQTAMKNGMFVISARNFAHVIGWRPIQSATSTNVGSFHAQPPFAGHPIVGAQVIKGSR